MDNYLKIISVTLCYLLPCHGCFFTFDQNIGFLLAFCLDLMDYVTLSGKNKCLHYILKCIHWLFLTQGNGVFEKKLMHFAPRNLLDIHVLSDYLESNRNLLGILLLSRIN